MKKIKKLEDSFYNTMNNGGWISIIAVAICGIIFAIIGIIFVHPMEIWAFILDFALIMIFTIAVRWILVTIRNMDDIKNNSKE